MWLELRHPRHAALSCGECRAYWYDADAKPVDRGRGDGKVRLKLRRPPTVPPPCSACPKIPDGVEKVAANAVELTDANRQAWEHYKECAAVGWQVPDAADPLVRANAKIIREVTDEVRDGDQRHLMALLAASLQARGNR